MLEQKQKLAEVLQADSTLVNMLASNKPFYNPSGTVAKVNSILPIGMIKSRMSYPVLAIQSGGSTKIGENFFDEIIFVRAYNSKDKSFVLVQQILERVKELLDGYEFNFVNSVHIKTMFEWCSPELEDEPLELNFQEMRFRTFIL